MQDKFAASPRRPKGGDMARPKPPVDQRKMRTSVSLQLKLVIAADAVRAEPRLAEMNMRDFSDIVARALYEYLERLSPGVVERTAARLRAEYGTRDQSMLRVAEDRPPTLPQANLPGMHQEALKKMRDLRLGAQPPPHKATHLPPKTSPSR